MQQYSKSFVHLVTVLLCLVSTPSIIAAEWTIPLVGNTYRTEPLSGSRGFRRGDSIRWRNPNHQYSVFFHLDQPAALVLTLHASEAAGPAKLQATINGDSFDLEFENEQKRCSVGSIRAPAGYLRVDIKGIERAEDSFPALQELVVKSDTKDLQLDFVRNNRGNMFYWGRRGPSVHLRYEVPQDRKLRFAYSEITVPVGQDPIGSYYMANGFGEGYFGIQVNSSTERRVLFSVWSPFKTDNPRDIPKEQRIVALGRGEGVRVGEFGNEGSGGQSYLIYPWEAGRTYRFLTEVTPDGDGNTVYASWFGDKAKNEWRLIARFRRPKTDTHLRGFHSFLESFSPTYGHIGRKANYGNVWVCDVDGKWHESTRARFSVDATGRGRHRLDFAGGSEGSTFYLRNCGFFNSSTEPGSQFTRESTQAEPPQIDFASLPR